MYLEMFRNIALISQKVKAVTVSQLLTLVAFVPTKARLGLYREKEKLPLYSVLLCWLTGEI